MDHKSRLGPAKDMPEREAPEVPTPDEEGLPAPYLDSSAQLEGWPGHRTMPGKSGLDPLESDFELAHVMGVLLRQLFTGQIRTHNPLALTLMVVLGVAFLAPVVLIFYESTLASWLCLAPLGLVGLALLANFVLSLRHPA